MVFIPIASQRLSARDDGDSQNDGDGDGSWGPMQIATPAIVGGVLLLLLATFIIWQRRRTHNRAYNYHQVRSEWVSKIERMLVPRRMRQRVLHSSAPVTLDDSMRMSTVSLDFRRSRQLRSDSSDSQTPLTSTGYNAFDYPPVPKLSDSPQPILKRRRVRWWWFFGSRPKEIKSSEPGSRWRVDAPDGSSTGHGHDDYRPRYVGDLEPMHEDPEEAGANRLGRIFPSVAPTPMAQRFLPEQARPLRGISTVPEYPGSFVTRTIPVASALFQSRSGTPVSSASRGLPPSYDVSQSHTLVHYPSAEEVVRLARAEPYAPMVIPAPLASRTAVYTPSPRGFHGRELSSDDFLAAQPPMTVATSLY